MKLTLCENPFDHSSDQREIALTPGETIGQALSREGEDCRYQLSCNGDLLPAETALTYVPRVGDDLQAVVALENSTLKSIALIGGTLLAAAFTYGASLTLFGSTIGFTGLGLSAGASSAVFSAASIGATLAVNAVASLFQQQPGGANYGVLGPQTVARSGIPIPKGYGTYRGAANIVESWVDIQGNNEDAHDVDDGADTIGRQYINCRADFGFGPARTITDLEINGKDISNYTDVAYCILYGTNDQAPVTADDSRWVVINRTNYGTTQNNEPTTAFDSINNNYAQGQRVRAEGTGVIIPGQRSDTEKLTVFVNFPQGVWRTDDSQQQKRAAISYDVYYRPAGSGDAGWIHVPGSGTPNGETHYYYNIRQTILRQATFVDGLTPGTYDTKVVKNGAGAVNNPLDYFEHESNLWGDQLWVESVQETSYTTLSYPNFIQICLRFMASDQLAGSDVNLSAVIEYGLRQPLPAELVGLPEDTPAAVAYDILADDVIGADLPDSRIDLDFFAQWAQLSQTLVDNGAGGTQKLAVFNGVFDQDGVNIWDAISSVGVMSRANFQRIGTKITGWLDQDDDPVQAFHVGNILADSYSKNYLGIDDRAQEVETTFADAADDYRTRNPLRVIASGDELSTDALKKTRINLLGCTDRVQAWYWSALRLRELETLLRTHTWQSNSQAIRCRTGNVVLLQHDVPRWGCGGNVQPGSSASKIILEANEFPDPTVEACTLIVIHPALQRMSVTVTGINAGVLTVTGYDGSTAVKRIRQGTADIAVTVTSPTTLKVADATGLVVGAASLWDLDVMENRNVTALTEDNVATLATPLSVVPEDFAGYIYQSVLRQAKTVRIKQMKKRVGDQRYTITAVDYDPTMYDVPAPVGLTG